MRRQLVPVVALATALAGAGGAGGDDGNGWKRDVRAAGHALTRAVELERITEADAARFRATLGRATAVRASVPPLRKRVIERVVAQISRYRAPASPRALILYGTLEANVDHLRRSGVPAPGTDVVAGDGIVYRATGENGLQFHPLANAGKLNAHVAHRDTRSARRLVDALALRGAETRGGGVAWEYPFDFGTVRAPWTSGMAQAVLAQALARAGLWLGDAATTALGARAFRAIPGALDIRLAAGPWVKLYSGSRLVVLNAQLQAAISLHDYAAIAADPPASAYAERLISSSKALLPEFDTGKWSRYALGQESSLAYHDYVITLLRRMGRITADGVWTETADRFEAYEREPPEIRGTSPSVTIYPRPRDGVRDSARVTFRLSKISRVTLVVDGKAVDSHVVHGGTQAIEWRPSGDVPEGSYAVRLVARDLAGNHGRAEAAAIEVARDLVPPALTAAAGRDRLYWRARDGESACCRIRLELGDGARARMVPLGRRGQGSARFADVLPAGTWEATLVVLDAAGNRAEHPLGRLVSRTAGSRR